jgi:hypothetical protein
MSEMRGPGCSMAVCPVAGRGERLVHWRTSGPRLFGQLFVVVVILIALSPVGASLTDSHSLNEQLIEGEGLVVASYSLQEHLVEGDVLSVTWEATGNLVFSIADPDGAVIREQTASRFGISIVDIEKTGVYVFTWENTELMFVTVSYNLELVDEGISTFAWIAIVGGILVGVVVLVMIAVLLHGPRKKAQQGPQIPQGNPACRPETGPCPGCGTPLDLQSQNCPRCGAKVRQSD